MVLRMAVVAMCCVCGGAGVGAAQAPASYLVQDGESRYCIVLAPESSPSEKQAAKELRTNVKLCTGGELPILEVPPADGGPMIVIGGGAVARQLGVDIDAVALGEQGYVLRTVSPHIVIAGTRAAGTLYGVYDFLEQCFGVRWFAPEAIRLPWAKDIPLPLLDATVQPAFFWRQTTYEWPKAAPVDGAHERRNSGKGGADNPYGIQYDCDGICHSYFNFISPGEFFGTHPEYFSEIGGVRREHEPQLCLTNPEVLDIVTERMLKRMEEHPDCRQYNFSQMDWYNYCQCPRCTEINRKYGTMGGTQFWFVNQLAERTAKVHPDKLIGTLAYMYTEEPPKDMTMHPNVAVWLCHMFPSCDSHSIAMCPLNADYKRRATAWAKITAHMYVWHYVTNFAHTYNPFPNFRAMANDMRFYHQLGVEGVFLQGWSTGSFHYLRQYLGMKLLWNPDQDANAVISDFLGGYYGAAADPIGRYIELLHDKVEQESIHMHLYTNPAQGYLTDDVLEKSLALFDEAETAVKGDAILLDRVRVARMPLIYARSFPRNGYTIEEGALKFNGPLAGLDEVNTFLERMKDHGFTAIREQSGDPMQMLLLCLGFHSTLPVVTLRNPKMSIDIVPFLGGRVLRIVDTASGQSVTAENVTRGLFFPLNGGEETRLGGAFSEGGFTEQYLIKQVDSRSITLEVPSQGMLARRTISLDPEQPEVAIEAALVNTTDKPRTVRLRSHLELDLGTLLATRIQFTDRAGQSVQRDMPPILAGMREGEHYLDQAAPKGAWSFSGSKGLTVTQRFDDAQVDYTWLYSYPDYLNELEAEVWGKEATIQPNETATFVHHIRVEPSATPPATAP